MKSNFKSDLNKERLLSNYLDECYQKHLKHYTFKRSTILEDQLKGVDLVLKHKRTGQTMLIDEKAQLDYLNENLPTFAFELYYEKHGEQKIGWLLDANKTTDFYALITGIYADEVDAFTACNITFVNRKKLITFLASRGLSIKKLKHLALSQPNFHGKMELERLNPYTEGYLYFSRKNKSEKPVNLILKLELLIQLKLGKRLV